MLLNKIHFTSKTNLKITAAYEEFNSFKNVKEKQQLLRLVMHTFDKYTRIFSYK